MSSPNEPANAHTEEEDELLFSDEESTSEEVTSKSYQPQILGTWKVLVVDDEEPVHAVTKLALKNFTFDKRSLEIISAYSAEEAQEVLLENLDTAVVFLDVVMESDHAGLDLIKFIRRTLNNHQIRIILRTGQPGLVPELSIVEGYDINDYKSKTELTQTKLFSALITAIRSYRDIIHVEESRQQIEDLNEKLQNFNQELERQVKARTQELEEKNQLLQQEVKARQTAQRRLEAVNAQLDQANRKLSFWANFDELTSLSNRRCFDKYLGQLWRQAFRDQEPLSIVLADIDFFKQFNDHYGHLSGDDCLKQVGLAFREVIVRPLDLAARYGGEEFIVVLHSTDIEGGDVVAHRLREAIEKLQIPHSQSGVSDHITMSFGVASVVPSPELHHEQLISKADQALYQAKKQGRNQVINFESLESKI